VSPWPSVAALAGETLPLGANARAPHRARGPIGHKRKAEDVTEDIAACAGTIPGRAVSDARLLAVGAAWV